MHACKQLVGSSILHEESKLTVSNSGNATIYLQAANELLTRLPAPSCPSCTPTIALMSIEPEALDLFEGDLLASSFNIRQLPIPTKGLTGHNQHDFNTWPVEDRIADTMVMLRDLTVLALHADAFIVTGSSNVGIAAMMFGGADKVIWSTDWRFQPTTRVRPTSYQFVLWVTMLCASHCILIIRNRWTD